MAPADAITKAVARVPKTRKGRKILRDRESQVVESAKTALILRGNKSCETVNQLLRDLHRLRNPLSVFFSRSHDIHPFENISRVEALCKNADHGLFAFGSSSKKRPARLILGRTFHASLLDMQEFSVENFKSINSFPNLKIDSVVGSKPMLLFQGSAFETDERMKKVKSLMLDFFGGASPDKILLEGLEHVFIFSAEALEHVPGAAEAPAPTVSVKRFHIQYKKSGSKLPRVELQEVGPSFDMKLDRCKDADRDLWKKAIKVPKQVKPKKVKNISTKATGKTTGKIHLGKQDFDGIHTIHHGKAKAKKLQGDLEAQAKKKRKVSAAKAAAA